ATPIFPAAPLRFSTTTDWPSSLLSCSARMRAETSVAPPGAKGATSVMGLAGHSCATAAPVNMHAAAASPRKVRRMIIDASLMETFLRHGLDQRPPMGRIIADAAELSTLLMKSFLLEMSQSSFCAYGKPAARRRGCGETPQPSRAERGGFDP